MNLTSNMKKIITLIVSLFIIFPAFAEDETTQLGKHMDELSGLLKSLRKVEGFDEKAAVVRQAQEELIKCFPLVPELTEKTEDPALKAAQVAEYKKLLAKNYMLLCDYELAFLSKDEEKADEIYDLLKKVKKDGHTNYIEE